MTPIKFDCLLPKLLLATWMLLIMSPSAWAEAVPKDTTRVALVIGNSNYQKGQLPNATNDAKDMAQALQKYGFTVIHKQDLDQDAMDQAIDDFEQRISKNGISLFYYAGHCMQIKGNNYLIPLNSKIEKQEQVRYRAVNAQKIIDMMTDAGGRVNIVILDASRENPFRGLFQTTGSGLAAMHIPQGIIVSYATAPGKTVGVGRDNGLYTENLLKAIEIPGLPIERVLKQTATDVERASGGQQVPWVSSWLTGKDFCFTPCRQVSPSVEQLLRICERHYKANRLTVGRGGTALACYEEVLKKDPMNEKALAGIEKIEARYVTWIKRALDKGQMKRAKRYLANLRKVNPESPNLAELEAEPSSFNIVKVNNVREFLEAIAPNTTIELKKGIYNISHAIDVKNKYIKWENPYDGYQPIIGPVENLTIKAENGTEILIEPQYAFVMSFENSRNILIQNVILGHTEGGHCIGGVLNFVKSDDIKIENSILFGSGTEGLVLEEVNNFEFRNSTIRDCTYDLMTITNSKNVLFENGTLKDTGEFDLINISNSSDVTFSRCTIQNNWTDSEYTPYLFSIDSNCSNISLENSIIRDNRTGKFLNNQNKLRLLNNQFIGNAFDEESLKIVWHRKIGVQSWRNNALIVGSHLFIGSSGQKWNEPDMADGIYAFDIKTGKQIWFVHSQNDFNDLAYMEGLIIGGSDAGEVFAVSAMSGKVKWQQKLDAKVYAKPAYLDAGVAVATGKGKLFLLNLNDGQVIDQVQLEGGVRAGMTAKGTNLWIATESGWVYELTAFGTFNFWRKFKVFYPDYFGSKLNESELPTGTLKYSYLGKDDNGKVGFSEARFYAAPLILDDKIILGFVRETYYSYPAVVAISSQHSGTEVAWFGTDDSQKLGDTFGNIRFTASEYKDLLIFGNPYSNKAYALSKQDGTLVWETSLGQPMFQHWPSPVVHGDYVYIARHDGYLHKLRAKDGKRMWSIFLGDSDSAGLIFRSEQDLPGDNLRTQWSPLRASPIFATPAISGKYIVIGTGEGDLYVIEQSGE